MTTRRHSLRVWARALAAPLVVAGGLGWGAADAQAAVSCSVSSTSASGRLVNFPSGLLGLGNTAYQSDFESSVTLTCSVGVGESNPNLHYEIGVSYGSNLSGSNQRRARSGSNLLNYQLYTSAQRLGTQIWAPLPASGSNIVTGLMNIPAGQSTASVVIPLYFAVPTNQGGGNATFTDTLSITASVRQGGVPVTSTLGTASVSIVRSGGGCAISTRPQSMVLQVQPPYPMASPVSATTPLALTCTPGIAPATVNLRQVTGANAEMFGLNYQVQLLNSSGQPLVLGVVSGLVNVVGCLLGPCYDNYDLQIRALVAAGQSPTFNPNDAGLCGATTCSETHTWEFVVTY